MISVGSSASSSSARVGGHGCHWGCVAAPHNPRTPHLPHSPPAMSRAHRQSRQRSDSLLAFAGAGLSFSPVLQPICGGEQVHPTCPPTPPITTLGCPCGGDAIPVDGADGGGIILLQPQEEPLYQAVDAGLLPALGE